MPKNVMYLISALVFHAFTDTILVIRRKHRQLIVRFGRKVSSSGIEEHAVEGAKVRILNPAKTVLANMPISSSGPHQVSPAGGRVAQSAGHS